MSLKDRVKEQDIRDRGNFGHRRLYTVCSIAGDNGFDVHTASCKDVKRGLSLGRKYGGGHLTQKVRQYADCNTYEADSAKDVVKHEIRELNSDFGEGVWDEDSFHIMPCIKEGEL